MRKRRATIKPSNITLGFIAILVSMVVLYLYFLNMSVVHVVMRTEYIRSHHELNASIAMLEAEYIKSQHIVASRIASLDGKVNDGDKIFVSREKASLVLRGN